MPLGRLSLSHLVPSACSFQGTFWAHVWAGLRGRLELLRSGSQSLSRPLTNASRLSIHWGNLTIQGPSLAQEKTKAGRGEGDLPRSHRLERDRIRSGIPIYWPPGPHFLSVQAHPNFSKSLFQESISLQSHTQKGILLPNGFKSFKWNQEEVIPVVSPGWSVQIGVWWRWRCGKLASSVLASFSIFSTPNVSQFLIPWWKQNPKEWKWNQGLVKDCPIRPKPRLHIYTALL